MMGMNVWTVRCGVLAAAAMLATCGGENPNEPSPPVATNTVTITTTGVNPKVALIAPGQRIRFVNNDVRAHNVASDPHPEHNDCPEFDQVGFLAVGQQRETGNFVTVKTCGYHDHDLPDLAQLKGQIQVR
jgi:plastocyanin